jgi:hypothetical protein
MIHSTFAGIVFVSLIENVMDGTLLMFSKYISPESV